MKSTRTRSRFIIFRARRAIAAAPAVWELEGPIMFGPSTSNTLIKDMLFLLNFVSCGRLLSAIKVNEAPPVVICRRDLYC